MYLVLFNFAALNIFTNILFNLPQDSYTFCQVMVFLFIFVLSPAMIRDYFLNFIYASD